MILNFYTKKDRRNWYVQFTDPKTGQRRSLSTTVRKGEVDQDLKLAKVRNRLEAEILESPVTRQDAVDEQHGWAWVLPWMEQHYRSKGASLVKRRNQWNHLSAYFHQQHVHSPAAVIRAHALAYVPWRTAQRKEKSKRSPGRNTALADLRFGTCILNEAVARGAIVVNPWTKLGFERNDSHERPEFTDDEIARVRAALEGKPEWMRVSFEIALHTGLRFSETRISMAHLDLAGRTAFIAAPKGGKVRAYSVPLPDALIPLLSNMKRQGKRETWSLPVAERPFTGLAWSKLFRELALGDGYCFHGTRVTFISRGARAGVPEHVMMRLVNHASSLVHRIYRRVRTDDVAPYVNRVPIPAASASTTGSPTRTPSRRAPATPRRASTRTRDCNQNPSAPRVQAA